VSTLASQLTSKLNSMKGLEKKLGEIHQYLTNVINGVIPMNHQILYNLQNIFNLSPNLRIDEVVRSFSLKNNDMMLVMYLSSLIRSIIALHDLINNKIANEEHAKKKLQGSAPEGEKAKDKEKEKEKEGSSKDKDKSSATKSDDKEKKNQKNRKTGH
jgi:26S proteasome regulatory subunit N8